MIMIMIMIIVVVIIQILEKMGKCPFQKKKKIQHFAPFSKIITEMPLF